MSGTITRFAFILHADVVGSTSLVQQDERQAHQLIQARFDSLASAVEQFGGVVEEIRGDAMVAIFDKASDIISAALSFQSQSCLWK